MKKRIIVITLVLIFAGTAVLGFDILNLTPEEAYEAASISNLQHEIDELNIDLREASLKTSIKNASHTAVDSYQGMLTKYATPYDAETNLMVSEKNLEKSEKQLMVTILSSMIYLNESKLSYDDSLSAYEKAEDAYRDALGNSAVTATELLSLEYTAMNNHIKMIQAQNNMEKAQKDLDTLLGIENTAVELPFEYNTPYNLDEELVLESMVATDISLFQAERSLESAKLKHEIASKFFDEDEETFISTLASMKSAEMNYNKKLRSLEDSVKDKMDQLKTLYDSIELEKLNVRIKKELYDSSLKQYKAGILAVNSLENAENTYVQAQRQLDSKIYDYIIACMQFSIDTGFEFPSS